MNCDVFRKKTSFSILLLFFFFLIFFFSLWTLWSFKTPETRGAKSALVAAKTSYGTDFASQVSAIDGNCIFFGVRVVKPASCGSSGGSSSSSRSSSSGKSVKFWLPASLPASLSASQPAVVEKMEIYEGEKTKYIRKPRGSVWNGQVFPFGQQAFREKKERWGGIRFFLLSSMGRQSFFLFSSSFFSLPIRLLILFFTGCKHLETTSKLRESVITKSCWQWPAEIDELLNDTFFFIRWMED